MVLKYYVNTIKRTLETKQCASGWAVDLGHLEGKYTQFYHIQQEVQMVLCDFEI